MLDLQGDVQHKGFRSVCFYLLNTSDEMALPVSKIDPALCDHIIVGHALIGPESLLWFQHPESNTEKLHELNTLKKKNPNLKILLSIRMGQSKVNSMNEFNILAAEEKRNQFVGSLIDLVSLYNLDGVDFFRLHQNETKYQESKSDLVSLLKLTRKECLRKGKLDTLLTATVSAHPDIASKFYNITELVRALII
ncbi:chitinase-3-like protein 1 isoform X2 [Tetranychus urticae]|uniref:chitinase-3-like protein 1 isoform X2 n=1 Tax=Tetranychus urticae TaxID=32264 RepID=UPI000D6473D8|nr:chitinase-3-like protein 1 isoform X2 [Tetranychus urticae]